MLVYATLAGNSGGAPANIDGGTRTSLVSFGSVIALLGSNGPNCAGLTGTTSNGFNFADDGSCGLPAPDTHAGVDPQLGALGSNGGPTQTRVPRSGSPLIDAIPVASCQADGASGITTDQRGVSRPQGPGCDIGAVEVQPVTPTPLVVTPKFTG
jgi:hypothetical protein